MSSGKVGAGHAQAMGRLGLKELRNALNPSRESVADQEIGLYGTQTQGEIAEARGGPGSGSEQESAKTQEKLSLASMREQVSKETPQQEQGKEASMQKEQEPERDM